MTGRDDLTLTRREAIARGAVGALPLLGIPAALDAAPRQRSGPNRLEITNHPISRLVSSLSVLVGQVVIDRTGLTGSYDLVLEFSPELPGVPGQRPFTDSSLPSIFTALQEQLGLKLDPSRGPVPVLLVERAEMPTED